jgi:hypothetical protein
MKARLRHSWEAWQDVARYVGDFQARALLTVFYFTLLAPFGFLVRTFTDPLHRRPGAPHTEWLERRTKDVDMAAARRQF